ncbi:MAG: hypothetical protein V4584_16790 [Verrucomicrobiota bacterium]
MKTLLTALVIAAGALLPAAQVQAAPVGKTTQFAAKSFGGFAPGKKFTFIVGEVVSAKATLGGVNKKTPVPKGIPKFKKGQKVKFAIGSKGELKGPGFAIKFETDGGTANVYVNKPKKATTLQADTATVYKDSANQPVGVALSFFKSTGTGFKTTVYSVYYTLD